MSAPVPPPLESVLKAFTVDHARRAIYFDYEGIPTKPPILLGWMVDEKYTAAILDDAYRDCAGRRYARTVIQGEHTTVAEALVRQAVTEDRHLVSWSWHDLKQIWPQLKAGSQGRLRERFVNAIRVARPWHHKHFKVVPLVGARLPYFAQAVAMNIPEKYGDKVVADHLGTVRNALTEHGTYGKMSPDDRQSWIRVVGHNKWDLQATSAVVVHVREGRAPDPNFDPFAHFAALVGADTSDA